MDGATGSIEQFPCFTEVRIRFESMNAWTTWVLFKYVNNVIAAILCNNRLWQMGQHHMFKYHSNWAKNPAAFQATQNWPPMLYIHMRVPRSAWCHGSSVWNASMSRAGPRNTGNRSPVRVRFWVELQFPAETKVRQWLGETGGKTLHFWMLVLYNLHPCDQINFWIPVVTSMGVGVDNGWWKWPRFTIWGKNPASNNGFCCWIFPLHN